MTGACFGGASTSAALSASVNSPIPYRYNTAGVCTDLRTGDAFTSRRNGAHNQPQISGAGFRRVQAHRFKGPDPRTHFFLVLRDIFVRRCPSFYYQNDIAKRRKVTKKGGHNRVPTLYFCRTPPQTSVHLALQFAARGIFVMRFVVAQSQRCIVVPTFGRILLTTKEVTLTHHAPIRRRIV